MNQIFSTLMAGQESQARTGSIGGLRFARVHEIKPEGYVLEWISGTVRSYSAPARVSSFMAGAERGAYFPFEVDDEVVVGFANGNLDEPVILGALWSDVDLPPPDADTSDTNNTRTIMSREGSELTFDDTPNATGVLLKSAGGMEIRMDDKNSKLLIKLNESTTIELSSQGVTVLGQTINLN